MNIRRFRSRCTAVLLSCFIGVGASFSSYQDAYANPLVLLLGTEVAIDGATALAWLLGACGFVSASVIVYKRADDFKAFGSAMLGAFERFVTLPHPQLSAPPVTGSDVQAWTDKLADGTLDTASPVWANYKLWLDSLQAGSGTVDCLPPYALSTASSQVQAQLALRLKNVDGGSLMSANVFCVNDSFGGPCAYVVSSFPFAMTYYYDGFNFAFRSSHYNVAVLEGHPNTPFFYAKLDLLNPEDVCTLFGLTADQMPPVHYDQKSILRLLTSFFFSYVAVGASAVVSYSHVHSGMSGVYERDKSYAGVDVVASNPAIAGAVATDVPIDWTGAGDIGRTVEGVSSGTLSPTDALDRAGVTVVDGVTSHVIDNTGITDRPASAAVSVPAVPGVIKEFTIPDLATVFPFCLPFDLIDFFALLQAPPEAPHFTFPIPYPTLHGMATYNLSIDFSPFEPVAEIFRTLETLGFIVGLILMTRSKMIRG